MNLRRLGVFGGSFDPIHLGHLLVALAAREEMELDRVFFVPAAQSPFKPERVLAPADLRLRMLRLALAGASWCEVDDQEVRRGGVSYTVDTLRDYAARHPGWRLFCLIGADNLPSLPQWRAPEDLARLAEFVVIPRPGEAVPLELPGFRTHRLGGWPLALSSSQVRARAKAGLPLDPLVPGPVAEVIRKNQLYL